MFHIKARIVETIYVIPIIFLLINMGRLYTLVFFLWPIVLKMISVFSIVELRISFLDEHGVGLYLSFIQNKNNENFIDCFEITVFHIKTRIVEAIWVILIIFFARKQLGRLYTLVFII